MFCKKYCGIEEVVKVYETDNFSPHLCDVQCLNSREMKYWQPYDFGSTLNFVVDEKNQKK